MPLRRLRFMLMPLRHDNNERYATLHATAASEAK